MFDWRVLRYEILQILEITTLVPKDTHLYFTRRKLISLHHAAVHHTAFNVSDIGQACLPLGFVLLPDLPEVLPRFDLLFFGCSDEIR